MQENKFLNLIRLVNLHLNIHLVTGKISPASAGGISEEEGIVGHYNDQIEEFHEIDNIQVNYKVTTFSLKTSLIFFFFFFRMKLV